jgi:ribose/xylose/arabinose/galactoside ABC-type transport system permease subunit
MEHYPAAVRLAEAANAAAPHQGAGYLLRVVLVVMILGCLLTGWFLLRGYKRNDD